MIVVEVNVVDGHNTEFYGYFEVESIEEAERIFHDAVFQKWFIRELNIQELPNDIILANEV
jgi:L-rhamnose mutarotase